MAQQRSCPRCGGPIRASARTCPQCTADLTAEPLERPVVTRVEHRQERRPAPPGLTPSDLHELAVHLPPGRVVIPLDYAAGRVVGEHRSDEPHLALAEVLREKLPGQQRAAADPLARYLLQLLEYQARATGSDVRHQLQLLAGSQATLVVEVGAEGEGPAVRVSMRSERNEPPADQPPVGSGQGPPAHRLRGAEGGRPTGCRIGCATAVLGLAGLLVAALVLAR